MFAILFCRQAGKREVFSALWWTQEQEREEEEIRGTSGGGEKVKFTFSRKETAIKLGELRIVPGPH